MEILRKLPCNQSCCILVFQEKTHLAHVASAASGIRTSFI